MNAAARLSVALLATSVVLKLAAIALAAGTPPDPRRPDDLGFLIWAPGVLMFAVVGALVAATRPRNPIGWLFLAVGIVEPFAMVVEGYAWAGLSTGTLLPGAALLATAGAAVNETALATILLVTLLFPTGAPPSRRWRPVVAIVLGWTAVGVVSRALAPGTLGETVPLDNPIGLPGPAGQLALAGRSLTEAVAPALVLLTAPALLVRYRRAGQVERAQLRWFAFAITVLVVFVVVVIPFWDPATVGPVVDTAFTFVLVAIVAAIPLSAGIAILRYRLYDIDVVIRRTLVYGALVGVLALVYVGLVLALQTALSSVTGGETLPVALSTLAIAALFGPVRRRVRYLVDRRFYRSRYDAQRTLEAFAGSVRDEVELEAVGAALVTVAGQAVAPRGAALWLRSRGR
ncbi:MAG TPA: hypothetical protein VM344_01090 [Vitreimonas sp.]|nr:hypothetical protein [Vitreimonas sp.]